MQLTLFTVLDLSVSLLLPTGLKAMATTAQRPEFVLRPFEAAGVGFEPTEPFGSATFKAAAFSHSATPPKQV
jgi:hypothetical protein